MSKKDIDPFFQELKVSEYSSIDPIIRDWAGKHQLRVLERHQDYEIRSVQTGFMTKGSRSYEINITPQDEKGITKVIIRNLNPPYNSETLSSTKVNLNQTLEQALRKAQGI